MDKQTFTRWFRQAASQLQVPDVKLQFMNANQARGELGRYEPGSNTVFIDDSQIQEDRNAINTGLHELAHAIVYSKNSEYLERQNGRITFNMNSPLATNQLNKLEYKGGHGSSWRETASRLGVRVNDYVDKEQDETGFGQIRFGLGFRRH